MLVQQTGNLELIVDMYNGMLEALLRVKKPLLKDRIEKMSKALQLPHKVAALGPLCHMESWLSRAS